MKPVPADLQSAGGEYGDLPSPMFAVAFIAATFRFGGKDNGFRWIAHAFFSHCKC